MTESADNEELELEHALTLARKAIELNNELLSRYEELSSIARPVFEDWLSRIEKTEDYWKLVDALGGEEKFASLQAEAKLFHSRRELNKVAAKKPRRDLLSRELANMLDSQPTISNDDVLAELSRMADARLDPIESVSIDEIEWIDKLGRIQTTSITALKKRITRLRESLPAE